ncbi:hypothetical protein A8L34_03440 [Bacillus sp. FJAT-27264]|uniref:hypothetical protein n=1 Tax=Paenibacillus sp. (strain DSM 101736 / FJAT-27264) TaxID=1850362 RepID=UPI000807CC07|nr:hypothetical protein [Bacillus sp. FJAT-27264]OBZ18636.1 hypothetical protein A8L34_03440 [Bacillus sp. FJAT-27264]
MSYRLKIKPLSLAAVLVAAVAVPFLVHADRGLAKETVISTQTAADWNVKHTSFRPSALTMSTGTSPGMSTGISSGTSYVLGTVSPWSKIVEKVKQLLGITPVPAYLKVTTVPLTFVPASRADLGSAQDSPVQKDNAPLRAEIVKGSFKAQSGF